MDGSIKNLLTGKVLEAIEKLSEFKLSSRYEKMCRNEAFEIGYSMQKMGIFNTKDAIELEKHIIASQPKELKPDIENFIMFLLAELCSSHVDRISKFIKIKGAHRKETQSYYGYVDMIAIYVIWVFNGPNLMGELLMTALYDDDDKFVRDVLKKIKEARKFI